MVPATVRLKSPGGPPSSKVLKSVIFSNLSISLNDTYPFDTQLVLSI